MFNNCPFNIHQNMIVTWKYRGSGFLKYSKSFFYKNVYSINFA